MTKADLTDRIYEKLGFSKRDSAELVDQTFELIKDVIASEGKLKIAGFGVFEARAKHERRGRNPQTGEELTITARRVLSFKPSPVLKARINGAKGHP